ILSISPMRMLAFLLPSASPPRALHSFPTRRSSDLRFILGAGDRSARSFGGGDWGEPQSTVLCSPKCSPVVAIRLGPSPTDCETRSEEHTSELQSHLNLVCRLLLEKKKYVTSSDMIT